MAKRTCSVDGCEVPHYSRGMCKPHYRRDYYRRNKARENAAFKAWRERQGAESLAARWEAWQAANGEQRNEQRRQDYAAEPEKYRERTRRYRAENPGSHRRWREANPERWALINRENQRRRRRTEGRPVSYAAVLERDGMVCHLCKGSIPSFEDLHFDHVVPLSRGGEHAEENIKPAHAGCNLAKGDKLLSELS